MQGILVILYTCTHSSICDILVSKEGLFMAQTDAQVRAAKKYREKFEFLQTRLPAEEKAIVTAHAETMGESLNAFVRRAISEAIERDRKEKQE
jgi:predicted HicB family RNase H-like nuclease